MVSLMGAFILIFLQQLFKSGFFQNSTRRLNITLCPFFHSYIYLELMQKVEMNQVGKFMVSALRVKSPSFYDFQKSDFTSD